TGWQPVPRRQAGKPDLLLLRLLPDRPVQPVTNRTRRYDLSDGVAYPADQLPTNPLRRVQSARRIFISRLVMRGSPSRVSTVRFARLTATRTALSERPHAKARSPARSS